MKASPVKLFGFSQTRTYLASENMRGYVEKCFSTTKPLLMGLEKKKKIPFTFLNKIVCSAEQQREPLLNKQPRKYS